MLTANEVDALERFRSAHGRQWKARLRAYWEHSYYPGCTEQDGELLQSVRNKIGPSGLMKYGRWTPREGMKVRVRHGVVIQIEDTGSFGDGVPLTPVGKGVITVEGGDLGTVEEVDPDYSRQFGVRGWFVWIDTKDVLAVLEKKEMEPA